MSNADDGRNTAWEPDSVPLALWEAVITHGPLSGPDVGRLRVALDTLADAELLASMVAAGAFHGADLVAAHREIRQARTTSSNVVAALTGGALSASGWGGARPGAGALRKEQAHRRPRGDR